MGPDDEVGDILHLPVQHTDDIAEGLPVGMGHAVCEIVRHDVTEGFRRLDPGSRHVEILDGWRFMLAQVRVRQEEPDTVQQFFSLVTGDSVFDIAPAPP